MSTTCKGWIDYGKSRVTKDSVMILHCAIKQIYRQNIHIRFVVCLSAYLCVYLSESMSVIQSSNNGNNIGSAYMPIRKLIA